MKTHFKLKPIWLTGVILLFTLQTVFAQNSVVWQPPDKIPGLIVTSDWQYPRIVVDPSGKIHIFNSQWAGEDFSIFHSEWSPGVGWKDPVDIFMLPHAQARLLDAFVDEQGRIYLLLWGGSDTGNAGDIADIYLIRAASENAGKAGAWSAPILIGPEAIAPSTGQMIYNGEGDIEVIYSGDVQGNGLYAVATKDYGETWSSPQIIFSTGSDTLWPAFLDMTRGSDSSIHAVWSLVGVDGLSMNIHYAGLSAGASEWSAPIILAEAVDYVADLASIIEYDHTLFVIYLNDLPTTRWMVRSADGGASWSTPERLFEHVGSNGAPSLVIDSSNTLHMFFGNRIGGSPQIHGLWHSIWLGDKWSVPEAITSGPLIPRSADGAEGYDPSLAQAIISQGQRLLVIYRMDGIVGPINIWYTSTNLTTPESAGSAPALGANQQTPTLLPVATDPPSTQAPQATSLPPVSTKSSIPNLGLLLIGGISPAVLLILAYAIWKNSRK